MYHRISLFVSDKGVFWVADKPTELELEYILFPWMRRSADEGHESQVRSSRSPTVGLYQCRQSPPHSHLHLRDLSMARLVECFLAMWERLFFIGNLNKWSVMSICSTLPYFMKINLFIIIYFDYLVICSVVNEMFAYFYYPDCLLFILDCC